MPRLMSCRCPNVNTNLLDARCEKVRTRQLVLGTELRGGEQMWQRLGGLVLLEQGLAQGPPRRKVAGSLAYRRPEQLDRFLILARAGERRGQGHLQCDIRWLKGRGSTKVFRGPIRRPAWLNANPK